MLYIGNIYPLPTLLMSESAGRRKCNTGSDRDRPPPDGAARLWPPSGILTLPWLILVCTVYTEIYFVRPSHEFYDATVELCMEFKEIVYFCIYWDILLAKSISPHIRKYTISLNIIRSYTVKRKTHDVRSMILVSQYEIYRSNIYCGVYWVHACIL